MLAFSQPVRLGDRITVGEQTGVVDEITLSYTALQTDEGRRVFVPNREMVASIIVNNSVADPRRLVAVQLPVRSTRPSARRAGSLGRPSRGRRATPSPSTSASGRSPTDRVAERGRLRTSRHERPADRERDPRAGARVAGRGRLLPSA